MKRNEKTSKIACEKILHNFNRNELNFQCQRWALAHGKCFVQRYFTQDDKIQNDSNVLLYPFTICPSPYPHSEYEKAHEIQHGINMFVQNLAFNIDLMDSVFKNLIEYDPFIKRLRTIYDQIQQLPYKSVAETCIIRSDYMLQQMNMFAQRTKLRLVEINTIAVGLGAAAKLIHDWHKQFLTQILPELVSQLPENESYNLVIDTLFESWKIYNNSRAIILFVVPEHEFNIGDQMLIEKGLLSFENSLLVKHVTFVDIYRNCSLDSKGILYFGNFEVAFVYYRTGYDPKHFYNEDIWQAYIMLESSCAIKCPSLRYHLAGMKCFQLATNDEEFLGKLFHEHEEYIDDFRYVLEDMFTMDQAINDPVLQRRILDKPDSLYLKQSREGGGNVYCGSLLKEHINEIIMNKQSNRYFLMSRIYPPIYSSLIRSARPNDNNEFISEKQINGELGVFGSLISRNGTVIFERIGGSLLRSKPAINVEGGIASGQGYIDSVFLV
ncbi:unnamed protein product [Rotaria socialis]|uniref:Glutathione synthetase n=1 Tax=Rotaria socialis TaxID=392032 RepID=A0A820DXW9_9BILA|nr:unnamed protein product [Rotaria socialis]CAF4245042.1 unnamed protein product [Rotaria socialis]